MKLATAVSNYVDHKRALGMRFKAEGFILRALCAALGDVPMDRVCAERVLEFLNGQNPSVVTASWTKKFSVLTGFYRFALARDYARTSPLPMRAPKMTVPAFIPYIYSREEIKRILDAVPQACSGNNVAVEADVYRTLLLLLYGAGLRLEEALSLKLADVDLDQAMLCIRETKFYKTRLVSLCMDLTFALALFVGRSSACNSHQPDAPFFLMRNGKRVSQSVARSAFRRVRALAGSVRIDGSRYQPRLHG